MHDWDEVRHATWLELFFDLVIVVAVANLGALLHDDHSLAGTLTVLGLLVAVWWAWISFSYYADLFDDDGPRDRLAQLAAMLGAAILAVAIAGGVGDDSALFALTFAAMFVLLALLYLAAGRAEPRARELCRWYVAGSATGAALWAASVLVTPPGRYWVWALALLANALISGPVAYALVGSAPQQVSHMPERFGLFVIVVLGEAVLAVVAGVGEADWQAASGLTAVAGFVVAAAIWWTYFDQFDEAAIDRALQGGRSTQIRSFVYGYGHLAVYAAIVVTGVGVELSIEEAAHGGSGVPLLGLGSAAVLGGFLLISSGIGRHAAPAALAAKAGLAGLSVAAPLVLDAAPATVVIALGWAALVALEVRLSPARSVQRA